MKDNELMVVKQLPVIIAQIDVIGKRADDLISQAESLVVTKDSKQVAKKIKSDLNKEKDMFEAVRIGIKKEIMKPYNEVEERFKTVIVKKYERAYQILNDKVLEIDNAEIAQKKQDVKDYFNEYLASNGIDFITFERANINVTLSATMKSLKEQAKKFIDEVVEALELIDTQEYKEEVLVEYKTSLNASNAIKNVISRHKAIEAELLKSGVRVQSQADEAKTVEKVDSLIAPVVIEREETLVFKFFVESTKEKLQALIAFLKEGGYIFGDIPEE